MLPFESIGRAATAAVFCTLSLFLLSACGQSQSPYVFSLVSGDISMGDAAPVDVRLTHQPTGKTIEGAVIFDIRFDMSPDAMGEMTAQASAQGSPAPGVYRFAVKPTMAGRWELKLGAKVQGEADTVRGSVIVTVR